MSISFAASSCSKMRSASATVTRFFVLRLGKNSAEHLTEIAALIHAAADDADRQRRGFLDFDLDQANVVEAALDLAARLVADSLRIRRNAYRRRVLRWGNVAAENRPQSGAERISLRVRSGRAGLGVEHVDDALDRVARRKLAHFLAAFVHDGTNRGFHEIAHHRLHVAADVSDLGILRRLDLDEGRADQGRQTPSDLGLADAGGADHQDVLRRDLLAQVFTGANAPVSVTQRDRDGALRLALSDDVLVELLDDLAGRQRSPDRAALSHAGHGSVSTMISVFV